MNLEICPFCCERKATLLCDFVIGFEWDGKLSTEERHYSVKTGECVYVSPVGLRFISIDGEIFTCDRPMCVECATQQSTVHYCGKGGCKRDTVDHCPQCQGNEPRGCVVLSKEEADGERERMRKRSVGVLQAVT